MSYLNNYNFWLSNVDNNAKQELLSIASDDKEIKERFTYPLEFGTAGMRGIIGYGMANMNEYTVARATQGLASYISTLGQESKNNGVVVSYDTRRKSFEFALTTAQVLGANGIKVYLFENVRPVPMCSFAVRHYGCCGGVMITASHNPKEYNGYKVYGDDGAQMSPEATAVVVDYMSKTDYFGITKEQVSINNRQDIDSKDNFKISDNIIVVGKSLDDLYFEQLQKLSLSPDEVQAVGSQIKIVYSPIHGSGYMPVTTILSKMGITASIVEEQRYPDTEFSTVVMPNPEQPDALALGIKLANKLGSDIVIGTDPDCDRMGVAIRDNNGQFVLLNGNQIGVMLMDYILMRNQQNGTLPANSAVIKTIVTSNFANIVADSYGVNVLDVLTGFKFIGEKIKEWESTFEHTFMFGFEESYGYLSGTHARDKDAVVATMLFAEMACYYQSNNIGLYDKLQNMYKQYGYFEDTSKAFAFKGLDGMTQMANIMNNYRNTDLDNIAGIKVVSKTDLLKGTIQYANGDIQKSTLPTTNVIKYNLGNNEWLCVRPSGTEPKLKIYVSTNGTTKQEAQQKNAMLLDAMQKMM